MKTAVACALLLLAGVLPAHAQTPNGADGKPLAFEVVSIRQSASGKQMPQFGPTANGYHAIGLPVLVSILQAELPTGAGESAYFTNDRILGAPDWVRSERYDIEAKVPEADLAEWHKTNAQPAMLHAMLRAMLVERFMLTLHRESKESPVYTLVLMKGGPKMKQTDPDTPHPTGIAMPGGTVMVPDQNGQLLNFYGASMSSLALVLSNFSGRPVIDQTGLTARYDFSLDRSAVMAMQMERAGVPQPPAGDSGLSIFTAVQEQLGLKMVSGKSTVETLVLDHIEKPTAN
jgi:uncharacterized protein (TIGR03435 family)